MGQEHTEALKKADGFSQGVHNSALCEQADIPEHQSLIEYSCNLDSIPQ